VHRYGINAGSPNAEVAQDFLRFLLSEEMQEEVADSGLLYPLTRASFRSMIESDLNGLEENMRRDYDDFDYVEKLDYPALIKEAEDYVDEIAYIVVQKPYYRTIIREVAKEFFLDRISAEEAARRMSDRVGLYLKEQG
jgi:ABC-type glycerol-3-phosphate transport system substrate-binding protein